MGGCASRGTSCNFSAHEIGAELLAILRPSAAERGLRRFFEPGVFDPAIAAMTSYRVADLGFARSQHVSARGIEGRAALVVEILSSSDESYEKLPFYRRVGVEELLSVDPRTKAFEVRRPEDDGWVVMTPAADGWVGLASLPVWLRTAGSRLQVETTDRDL